MSDLELLPNLCEELMLKIEFKESEAPEWITGDFRNSNFYKVKLSSKILGGKPLKTKFGCGDESKVTAHDVLFCVAMDHHTLISCRDKIDFIKEFDYEFRQGELVWKSLKKSSKKFLEFVPDEHDRNEILHAACNY